MPDSEQIARMKKDRFICDLVGIHLEEVREGYAKSSLQIRPEHLNGVGIVQGGVLFSLADYTFAAAGNWDVPMIGIENHITFLSSVSEGTIYAEAKEISRSGHFSVSEVRVTNEKGTLLAFLTGRGYLMR